MCSLLSTDKSFHKTNIFSQVIWIFFLVLRVLWKVLRHLFSFPSTFFPIFENECNYLQFLELLEGVFFNLVMHLKLLLHVLQVCFQFLTLCQGTGSLLPFIFQLCFQVSQLFQKTSPLLFCLFFLCLKTREQSYKCVSKAYFNCNQKQNLHFNK